METHGGVTNRFPRLSACVPPDERDMTTTILSPPPSISSPRANSPEKDSQEWRHKMATKKERAEAEIKSFNSDDDEDSSDLWLDLASSLPQPRFLLFHELSRVQSGESPTANTRRSAQWIVAPLIPLFLCAVYVNTRAGKYTCIMMIYNKKKIVKMKKRRENPQSSASSRLPRGGAPQRRRRQWLRSAHT